MRGEIPAWSGSGAESGFVYVESRGDSWGSDYPPAGNVGAPFNVPVSGVWDGRAEGTSYLGTPGAGAIEVYIDGGYVGQLFMYFNQVNTHTSMIPAIFNLTLAPGTHWLWLRKVFVSSDGNDFVKVSGRVFPA